MKKNLLFAFAAILWLAAVTGAYYYTHTPFTLEFARNIALAGWRLTVAVLILSVAGGLGRRVLPQPPRVALFWLAVQAALGLGILGTAIFLVGWAVGFNLWFFVVLLVGLVILLRRDILDWVSRWQSLFVLWQAGGRLAQFIGLGCLILFGFTLLAALAPPTKFDALVYHLTLPKTYLDAGQITYQPWLIFWGMPQLMEMLYTWVIALGGTEAAPVLGWSIGFLTLIGMVDWGMRKLSPRAGWVAAACLLCGFTLVMSLSWGYVDWLVMLFGLVTVILLDEWQATEEPKIAILAGVVAGFALGTKYTAGVLALGGALVIILYSWREWRNIAKNLLLFSVPVVAAFLPWMLKNLLATGNPFYPLFFPAGAMNATRIAFYQGSPLGDWRDVILLPWQATMLGVEGGERYSATIGPLLLGFGLLGGFGWRFGREKKGLVPIMVITLTGLVFWAVVGRFTTLGLQSRLFMVIFPAIALLAGLGFDALERVQVPGVRLGRVAGSVLLLVFGLNILEISTYSLQQGGLQYFFGLVSAEDYQNTNLGMTNLAYLAIHELPEESRTLMLWEPRSLACTPKCIPDEIVDRWLADRTAYGNAEAILDSWQRLGYTHVLVYHFGTDFYRNAPQSYYQTEDWHTLDELLASLSVQTDLNGVYTLYSLTP